MNPAAPVGKIEHVMHHWPSGRAHVNGGYPFVLRQSQRNGNVSINVRAIRRDVLIDFIGISSYGKGKITSGAVKLTKDLDSTVDGADILLVEDIVDSGVTLNYLVNVLQQRKPRSVRIAALLDKPDRRVRAVKAAYIGFEIPDEFVVGYGLDFGERYRNLKDICVLEEGHAA